MAALAACLALAGCQRAARPAETGGLAPGKITGKVLDGAGRPVAGAQVGVLQGVVTEERLGDTTLDDCYTTTTDANGAFEVHLSGVGITPRPHRGWSVWARHDARGLIGAVTFRTMPEKPLEIRLAPASYVHARALDAEGKPISGLAMSVWLTEVGCSLPYLPTDAQGEVRFGPLPADLPLRVNFPGRLGYLVLNDDWPFDQATLGPGIVLAAGETRDLPALRVGVAQGTLRGTVVGEDGRPAAGAQVRAIIPSAFPIKTVTNAEGSFALTGPLPTSADLWVLASHPVERLHVAQKLGPTTRECRLVLRPLTSARGQLADAQGQPVAGVPVVAASSVRVGAGDTEDPWLFHGVLRPTPDPCRTDAQGFWAFEGLVAGAPYKVHVLDTVLSFDKGRLSFVADADDPVDVGLVMPRN
jgi:hypothetical protein